MMNISVEVVDGTFGRAAEGVPVTLLREVDAAWQELARARTGDNGRIDELAAIPGRGRYRVVLDLDRYFPGLGVAPFQSRIDVAFRVSNPGEPVRFVLIVTPSSVTSCRLTTDAGSTR
jgi:5-hydroxyisourate hydrolase-like protein (transthyretin family)